MISGFQILRQARATVVEIESDRWISNSLNLHTLEFSYNSRLVQHLVSPHVVESLCQAKAPLSGLELAAQSSLQTQAANNITPAITTVSATIHPPATLNHYHYNRLYHYLYYQYHHRYDIHYHQHYRHYHHRDHHNHQHHLHRYPGHCHHHYKTITIITISISITITTAITTTLTTLSSLPASLSSPLPLTRLQLLLQPLPPLLLFFPGRNQ
ncbi:hypothetical protein PoB_006662500 [Plakobranchus ocellatus]|uniref:Uncharacterized protein n=1 Tax=Plakobranchus ocellatus TaxID=259542 RepID=A0AAV4D7M3_9GAST|nr:hypothetical protein PoB_006662500 [Plakobranchus ocellatus]